VRRRADPNGLWPGWRNVQFNIVFGILEAREITDKGTLNHPAVLKKSSHTGGSAPSGTRGDRCFQSSEGIVSHVLKQSFLQIRRPAYFGLPKYRQPIAEFR